MDDAKSPSLMSARERTNEVALILAAGLARLRLQLVNNPPRRGCPPSSEREEMTGFPRQKEPFMVTPNERHGETERQGDSKE